MVCHLIYGMFTPASRPNMKMAPVQSHSLDYWIQSLIYVTLCTVYENTLLLFFFLFGIIVTSSVLPVRAFISREHYFQEVIYCVKVWIWATFMRRTKKQVVVTYCWFRGGLCNHTTCEPVALPWRESSIHALPRVWPNFCREMCVSVCVWRRDANGSGVMVFCCGWIKCTLRHKLYFKKKVHIWNTHFF